MKPGSEILVSCADRIVWVRVEGNGSSTNSTALRDFAKDDPSRRPRVHRRSVQLSGDGFDVYGHARWNLVVAWRAGRMRVGSRPCALGRTGNPLYGVGG